VCVLRPKAKLIIGGSNGLGRLQGITFQHSSCISSFKSFCAATIPFYNCTACYTSILSLEEFSWLLNWGASSPRDLSEINGNGY